MTTKSMFSFKKNKTRDEINPGLISSLRNKLAKTRHSLVEGISDIFLGDKKFDDELREQLEDQLLISDVGIEASQKITSKLTEDLARRELAEKDSVFQALEVAMIDILATSNQPLLIDPEKKPFVILMAGINGAGKTTTIGKLASQFKKQGLNIMLAAGDTFRAAAVEQLQGWGQRLDIPVVSQGQGADAASVIYDALQSARSKKIDVLIADTAGRLHTQSNLMNELEKIKRVMKKLDPEAPHETMLVIDAGTGQNALVQAKNFHDTLELTGITLTKLDGTAKGGMLFNISEQLKIPIRYIGVGESPEDLRVFDAKEFTRALLSQ